MCKFNGTKLNKDQYVLLTGCKVKGENALYKVTRDIANDENYLGDNGYLLEKVKLNGEIKTSGYTLYFYDNNGIKHDPQVTAKPLNNISELKEANKELKTYLISRDNKTIVNKINETDIKIDLNAVGTEYKVKMINQVKFSTNGYSNNKAFKKDQYFKIKVIEGQRIRTELLNKTGESYCFDTAMKYSHNLNKNLTQEFINNSVVIEIAKVTKESLEETKKEIKKEEIKPVEVVETSKSVQETILQTPVIEKTEEPQQENNSQVVAENKTTQNDNNSIEFTIVEDTHTKTGKKIFVAKLTEKVEYEEFKNIESKIKSIGGYYSRFKKGFLFKEEPTQLLNDTFDSSESNIIAQELKEVVYPEIDINDIESYIVDEKLSKRENSISMFRREDKDHNKEIQSLMINANTEILEALKSNTKPYIEYRAKQYLQGWKKKYYTLYIKMITHKANNPSWAVTGRGNLNVNRYNKKQSQYEKMIGESVKLTEEFNNKISNIKWQVKKQVQEQEKKETEIIMNSDIDISKFEKKTIKYNVGAVNNIFNNSNKEIKVNYYQGYYIFNNWGCWRCYDEQGKEIFQTKTTGTLLEAKKKLIVLLNNSIAV